MTIRKRKKRSPLADLPDFFKPTPEEVERKKEHDKEVARVKAEAAKRNVTGVYDPDVEAKDRRYWHNKFYPN